jgi:hypothetical protein
MSTALMSNFAIQGWQLGRKALIPIIGLYLTLPRNPIRLALALGAGNEIEVFGHFYGSSVSRPSGDQARPLRHNPSSVDGSR